MLPLESPDPPQNCGVHNSSAGRLEVVCVAGNDGGLAQHFVLEVGIPLVCIR